MKALIRLQVLKNKSVPFLITGIMAILLLWILTIKMAVEPDTPTKITFNLSFVNFALLIYIYKNIIKRQTMSKEGFLLRLPLSDREILLGNIAGLSIISILTIALSIVVSAIIIGFFKFLGLNIFIDYNSFSPDQFFTFLYIIMYIGVFFSLHTYLTSYRARNVSTLLCISIPILLLFITPTLLALIFHSTKVHITGKELAMIFNPTILHYLKLFFAKIWEFRLVIGFAIIFLLYRIRYLSEV